MVRCGVHISIAGSVAKSVDRAAETGCDCFQIFTRSPRVWRAKELSQEECGAFVSKLSGSGIGPVFDHMPYLPNLASEDPVLWDRSVETLAEELRRCQCLRVPYLVTHLGHHGVSGIVEGQRRVAEAVNRAFEKVTGNGTTLLLENTAGEKNGVGSRLFDIARVYSLVDDPSRVGFCFDTCHAFAAGYPVHTPSGLDATLAEFDSLLGLSRLALVHFNDAKGALGSGLDRHEHIGLGSIGPDGCAGILAHPSLRDLPFVCETPVDDRRDDRGTVAVVRELADRHV